MALITKLYDFGIPRRPKYMRKKKWEKYLKDNDLWIDADKLNRLIDNVDLTPLTTRSE